MIRFMLWPKFWILVNTGMIAFAVTSKMVS